MAPWNGRARSAPSSQSVSPAHARHAMRQAGDRCGGARGVGSRHARALPRLPAPIRRRGGARRCPACRSPRVTRPPRARRPRPSPTWTATPSSPRVEKRDDPALRDVPVIVGGGKRGVVSTACYLARIKGVRSAMPMFEALRLCPEAVVVKPRFAAYVEASSAIRAMMEEITDRIEPLSLDEAFLDLSGTERLHGAPAGGDARAAGAADGGRAGADRLGRPLAQQVPGQGRLRPRQAARLLGDRPGRDGGLPRPPPGPPDLGHRPRRRRRRWSARASGSSATCCAGSGRDARGAVRLAWATRLWHLARGEDVRARATSARSRSRSPTRPPSTPTPPTARCSTATSGGWPRRSSRPRQGQGARGPRGGPEAQAARPPAADPAGRRCASPRRSPTPSTAPPAASSTRWHEPGPFRLLGVGLSGSWTPGWPTARATCSTPARRGGRRPSGRPTRSAPASATRPSSRAARCADARAAPRRSRRLPRAPAGRRSPHGRRRPLPAPHPAGRRLRFGPGKAELLTRIRETGSVSAAAQAMGMSYRRAWGLVAEANRAFRSPAGRDVARAARAAAGRGSPRRARRCWPRSGRWSGWSRPRAPPSSPRSGTGSICRDGNNAGRRPPPGRTSRPDISPRRSPHAPRRPPRSPPRSPARPPPRPSPSSPPPRCRPRSTPLAEAFAAATGNEVAVSYGGSSALARQIGEGAPAQVFISASEEWMDDLAGRA